MTTNREVLITVFAAYIDPHRPLTESSFADASAAAYSLVGRRPSCESLHRTYLQLLRELGSRQALDQAASSLLAKMQATVEHASRDGGAERRPTAAAGQRTTANNRGNNNNPAAPLAKDDLLHMWARCCTAPFASDTFMVPVGAKIMMTYSQSNLGPYSSVIRQPLCLDDVQRQILAGKIRTTEQLKAAIWRIAANCTAFNAPEGEYPKRARLFACACIDAIDDELAAASGGAEFDDSGNALKKRRLM